MKSSTFAFVRYRNLEEAKRAVTEADGRWIVGRSIRVFLSLEKLLDDESKSDASLGDIPLNEIELTKEEIGWRSKCPRAWKSRAELLHSWLDLLEKLEGFDGKRSIKIWVTLQNVPIQLWYDRFFSDICSRWGRVLKIDEEMSNRGLFDIAKVLLSVKKQSCVPDRISINVNGNVSDIIVRTEEYDGERLFIDGCSPYKTTGEENLIVHGAVIEHDGENDDDDVFNPEKDGNDEARANGFCQEVVGNTVNVLPRSGLSIVPFPSISNGLRLQDVPIEMVNEIDVECVGQTRAHVALSDNYILSPLAVTQVESIPITSGSDQIKRKNIKKTKGMGGGINRKGMQSKGKGDEPQIDPHDVGETSQSEGQSEAELIFMVGKILGVEFHEQDNEVIRRLKLLESDTLFFFLQL
ncbi:hypothetical protein F3Y22_tig00112501pilonHSYRG00058 [Hibiscus syriacus]|uniref:Uncharacterized protein n=1 Tax=Hibiscus syriacus TaxID=106335 RepID=A0A6A2Y2X1_HIBSY|nr:hypothetical protein F3Y22_tig00112501pilonHSYRG00058 [Hibiscus syriacus]